MKTAQQQQAKHLYFNSNKTIREIATEVDVDERTLYRWARKEAWDKLRQAALVAPAIAVENMFNQLLKLQKFIAGRGEDFQFPTIQEAEITRKLVNCITQMNKYLELGMNIRVRSGFLDYVEFTDFDMAMKLAKYSDSYFMDEKSEYKPYPWHNLEQQQAGDESKMSDEELIVTPDILQKKETENHDNESITMKDIPKIVCHQPDNIGHSEVYAQYPNAPVLPGRVIWLGRNNVYDLMTAEYRTMTFDESNDFYKMGVDTDWLKYH